MLYFRYSRCLYAGTAGNARTVPPFRAFFVVHLRLIAR